MTALPNAAPLIELQREFGTTAEPLHQTLDGNTKEGLYMPFARKRRAESVGIGGATREVYFYPSNSIE